MDKYFTFSGNQEHFINSTTENYKTIVASPSVFHKKLNFSSDLEIKGSLFKVLFAHFQYLSLVKKTNMNISQVEAEVLLHDGVEQVPTGQAGVRHADLFL